MKDSQDNFHDKCPMKWWSASAGARRRTRPGLTTGTGRRILRLTRMAAAQMCCRRLLRLAWIMLLFIEQCLNGLQFGLLLFLLAAGLTLVFGIMDLVNLAHGSLYMMGAYFAATFAAWTGTFLLGGAARARRTLLLGMAVEVVAMRRLYGRDHLDQVLATFGLILFFNELVRLIWGPAADLCRCRIGSQPVAILPGVHYPAYRLRDHRGRR